MPRKLPVYFLVNIAQSQINPFENGYSKILQVVENLPWLHQTEWFSLIQVREEPCLLRSLIHNQYFSMPVCSSNSDDYLGRGIKFLTERIDKEVTKGNVKLELKGDFKSKVFLFLDSIPSDNCEVEFQKLLIKHRSEIVLIYAKTLDVMFQKTIMKYCSNVLQIDELTVRKIEECFSWVCGEDNTCQYLKNLNPKPPEEEINSMLPPFTKIDFEELS